MNNNLQDNKIGAKEHRERETRITFPQQHDARNDQIEKLNNSPHNKILIEVFQICFITIVIAMSLTVVRVKNDLMSSNGVNGYTRKWLCFLDLAPRILVSIILPLAIHIRNPEIRKYIKGVFGA